MNTIESLKKQLADATDPQEYDALQAEIAYIAKRESLKAASEKKEREEAEALRRQALYDERESLFLEGEELKSDFLGNAKPQLVKAYNLVYQTIGLIWAKAKRLKQIKRRIDTIDQEIGFKQEFGYSQVMANLWGAGLEGDPGQAMKALNQRFYDVWRKDGSKIEPVITFTVENVDKI